MKVSRGFALDLADMKLIDDAARELGVTENAALALLVRHGSVRLRQVDRQASRLAPDNSDLR